MHPLLDQYLCKKYPKIFADRNKSPMESCMHWGLAVNNGWFYLIDALCDRIQQHIDQHNECVDEGYEWAVKEGKIPQVVALQVKEKFSGLRFYYSGGDKYIEGVVSMAEDFSYRICEECGRMDETIGRNQKGWIVTTCEDHRRNKNDFHRNGDEELDKIWKKVHKDEEKEQQRIQATSAQV